MNYEEVIVIIKDNGIVSIDEKQLIWDKIRNCFFDANRLMYIPTDEEIKSDFWIIL